MQQTAPIQSSPEATMLAALFVLFPSGVTEVIKAMYLSDLAAQHFDPDDLAEACERIRHTYEKTRVPPFALILKTCRTAYQDRAKAGSSVETTLSGADARSLAIRRLRYRGQPTDEARIDGELEFMRGCGFSLGDAA